MDDIRLRIILGVGGMEAVNKAGAALQRVTDKARDSSGAINNSGATASKNAGLFSRLADTLRQTEAMYDRVYRAGFQLQMVGDGIYDTGMKGIQMLGGTVDAYKDYDFILRRAGTALNTNEEWQVKLDKAIQGTAKAVGLVDPEEVAEAYYYWGAAAGTVVDEQKKLNEITEVVRKVLVTTAAAGGDLEGNLKGVYGILSVYNLGADKAGDVTEKLAYMTERTAADFGDLTSSFSYIGPLASSLGVTFEDTASILGVLADAGQRGSRAGRGFSMVIEGLSNPSKAAAKALNIVAEKVGGVGTEFTDLVFPEGKFTGMRNLVHMLAEGMDGLDDKTKGYILSAGFTNNATRALIPLIEEQIALNKQQAATGGEVISVMDQTKYSLEHAADFYKQMNKNMTESINAVIGSLHNTFFPIIQKVATSVMKQLIPIFDALKGAFDELAKWMDNNPAIVDFIVKFIAIGSVIAIVVGSVLSAIGAFLLLGAGISTAIAILGTLAAAAAPVIAVIAAIVAGGALLFMAWQENWFGIQQIVGNAVAVITSVLQTLQSWVRKGVDLFMNLVSGGDAVAACFSGLPAPVQAFVEWLAKLWTAGVSAFNALLPTVQTFVNTVVNLFGSYIIPAVQSLIEAFMNVWAVVEPILIAFGTILVDTIVNTVIPMLVEFATAISTYIIEILTMVGPVIESVVAAFTGLINFIFKDLAPVWSWLLDNVLVPFFKGAVDLFVTRLQGILNIVQGAFEAIKGVIQVVLSVIKGVIDVFLALINGDFNKAGQALKTMVSGIWEGIKAIINGVLTVITGIIEFAISTIFSIIGKGLGLVKNLFSNVFNGILSFLKGIFGQMTSIGGGIITNLWKGISGAIGGFFGNVAKFIGDLIGKFTGKLPTQMVSIGKDVIEGLWKGLQSMAGWIASKVKDLINAIIPGPIKDILGIKSPSRVTAELGKMVALGLAMGMDQNTKPVLDSVDRLTGAVIARADRAGRDMNSAMAEASMTAGNFSFSASNERTLTLRVEVVSPDGSVDRLTADQIAGLLRSSDLISSIEHAASLD